VLRARIIRPIPVFTIALPLILLWITAPSLVLAASPPGDAVGHVVESISPNLHQMDDWGEHGRKAKVMLILFQLAAMLVAANCSPVWSSGRFCSGR
jgi:hypothetical protein